jgi:hypothetical protein
VADDGVNVEAYQTCGGHPYIGDTRNNSGIHCRDNNKAGVRYMFLLVVAKDGLVVLQQLMSGMTTHS